MDIFANFTTIICFAHYPCKKLIPYFCKQSQAVFIYIYIYSVRTLYLNEKLILYFCKQSQAVFLLLFSSYKLFRYCSKYKRFAK